MSGRGVIKVVLFLLITFAITLIYDFSVLMPLYDPMEGSSPRFQLLVSARLFIPLISVVMVLKAVGEGVKAGLRSYGMVLCKLRRLIPAASVPYIMYGLGTLYALVSGLPVTNPLIPLYTEYGQPVPTGLIDLTILLTLSLLSSLFVGATINAAIMLGQEVGWRGLLFDELLTITNSFSITNLIIGTVWGLWYAPLIILYGYNYPNHRDFIGVAMFIAVCITWSIILSQLKIMSRSLLAPAVMLGVLNLIAGLMFYTILVKDEIYSMPVGLMGLASSATMAVMILRSRVRAARKSNQYVNSGG